MYRILYKSTRGVPSPHVNSGWLFYQENGTTWGTDDSKVALTKYNSLLCNYAKGCIKLIQEIDVTTTVSTDSVTCGTPKWVDLDKGGLK